MVIKEFEAQPIVAVRRTAMLADLPKVIPPAYAELWEFISAAHIEVGRNVVVYLDDVMNIEIGVEAMVPFAPAGNVIQSILPAGKVIVVEHTGPYQDLPQVHQAIHKFSEVKNLKIVRPCWEIYGDWTDDPSRLRTDVCYLVEEK